MLRHCEREADCCFRVPGVDPITSALPARVKQPVADSSRPENKRRAVVVLLPGAAGRVGAHRSHDRVEHEDERENRASHHGRIFRRVPT